MPNDKISYVTTYGAKPGSDPMGDLDDSASYEQVSQVYKPSAKNDRSAGMDVDEDHGGVNSTTIIPPGGAGDSITTHDSVGEQPEIAGSLVRPAKEYSHGGEFKE